MNINIQFNAKGFIGLFAKPFENSIDIERWIFFIHFEITDKRRDEVTPMLCPTDSYERLIEGFSWRIPERYNIGVDTCDKWADGSARLALIYEKHDGTQTRYTFDELKSLSNRLANSFAKHGVARGECVGIFLPQTPETALAHLAAYKLGAIAVPLFALRSEEHT